MAWVHQIKFFIKNQELYIALYDNSHLNEFWIDNLKAIELGVSKLPHNFILERKYLIEDLNIPSFEHSQDKLIFKISDFANRLVKGKIGSRMRVENKINSDRKIEIGNGNYNEHIAGDYYERGNSTVSNINQTHSGSGDNVAGDKNTTNNYNSQDLKQAAAEIQSLLVQLEHTYPADTTLGKVAIAEEAVKQIEGNSQLASRVLSALKTGGTSALDSFLDHPAASFVIAALEDWQATKPNREVPKFTAQFYEWKSHLVSNINIMGGQTVFPNSRLSVHHIGNIVNRGESFQTIKEDYPYLSEQDLKFASLYVNNSMTVGRIDQG